ncbi:MAG: hypothetical protein JXR96_26825 [Deltaproteobacteria bacterium]|nr:hypothetical protein [Deltaproteobacteria bacterium]
MIRFFCVLGVCAVCLQACTVAAPAARPHTEPPGPFHCRARPGPEPELAELPAFDLPPGRLEIACRDVEPSGDRPAAAGSVSEIVSRAGKRCRVVAENVPLRVLASELSQALGVDMAVGPRLGRLQVALWLPDVSTEELLRLLGESCGAEPWATGGVLFLGRGRDLEARTRAQRSRLMLEPLRQRLFPVRAGRSPEQIAAVFCELVAGPRGEAVVIGDQILIQDVLERLDQMDKLAAELERLPGCSGPGGPAFTCRRPEALPGTAEPPPAPRPDPGPAGRLELSWPGGPLAGADEPASRRSLEQRACRVLAENVPLGSLGVELGRALGIGVLVGPQLVGRRVSIFLPHGTLGELIAALEAYPAYRAVFRRGVLSLRPGDAGPACKYRPVESLRIFEIEPGLPAAQIAAACCRFVLSSRGALALVGRALVVRDRLDSLDRIQKLLEVLPLAAQPERPRAQPEPVQVPPGPEPGQAPPGPEPGQAPPGPEPGQAPTPSTPEGP